MCKLHISWGPPRPLSPPVKNSVFAPDMNTGSQHPTIELAQYAAMQHFLRHRPSLLSRSPIRRAGVNKLTTSFWLGKNANRLCGDLHQLSLSPAKSITFSIPFKTCSTNCKSYVPCITSTLCVHACLRAYTHPQATALPIIRVTDRLTDYGRIVCLVCVCDVTESAISPCNTNSFCTHPPSRTATRLSVQSFLFFFDIAVDPLGSAGWWV